MCFWIFAGLACKPRPLRTSLWIFSVFPLFEPFASKRAPLCSLTNSGVCFFPSPSPRVGLNYSGSALSSKKESLFSPRSVNDSRDLPLNERLLETPVLPLRWTAEAHKPRVSLFDRRLALAHKCRLIQRSAIFSSPHTQMFFG